MNEILNKRRRLSHGGGENLDYVESNYVTLVAWTAARAVIDPGEHGSPGPVLDASGSMLSQLFSWSQEKSSSRIVR